MQKLGGVAILQDKQDQLIELVRFAESLNIPLLVLNPESADRDLEIFVRKHQIVRAFCLSFPRKFTVENLGLFEDGIWNFHFGELPKYAGADPLFWVLKNGDTSISLVCHKMNEEWDGGEVISQVSVPIFPGENYGLLGARLSQKAADLIATFFTNSHPLPDRKKLSLGGTHTKRPGFKDFLIDWANQSSEQIEHLVNACNPVYGGAVTQLGTSYIHILEVSPAMVRDTALFGPGSIVHSSAEDGLFVLCSDYKYLKINIVKTPESILSGNKLAALGLQKGAKLGNPARPSVKSTLIL
ncbi:methionyl-tRNA formyltransferase [Algoriphagus namhaensis]